MDCVLGSKTGLKNELFTAQRNRITSGFFISAIFYSERAPSGFVPG
jgi:hypothetical protein